MFSPIPARVAWVFFLWIACTGKTVFAEFETRSSLSVSTEPFSFAVGDFNRDGTLDLAVTSYLPTNGINILLGNGDGTFRHGVSYSVGVQLAYITTASLRHNSILDLVVADTLSNDIYVLPGNGDGTFQPAVAYPAIGASRTVNVADFTGDRKLDIIAITASVQCNCLSVFPGNGDGTFQAAVTTDIPDIDGFAVAVGDFDEDAKLDVAVSGFFGTANQVDIFHGNGDGTFRSNGHYDIGLFPMSLAMADFNEDKKADLAVGVYQGVGVLLGNGDGTFQQPVIYPTKYPTSVVAQDLDGDGHLDLAVSNNGQIGIPAGASVFRGNGDGTFQAAVLYPAGREQVNFVAAGDFNGDHHLDLVVAGYLDDAVVTLLNTGVVTFSPTTPIRFPDQLVGTTSSAQTVTLRNTGTSPLTISSTSLKGSFNLDSTTCGTSVAPGARCSMKVSFLPQSQGPKPGTISIIDSASSRPQVVVLIGAGTVVELLPGSLTFSAQRVGTKSAAQQVRLTNTGATTLDISKIEILKGDSQEFSQTNTCPPSLSSGASCVIRVTFAPRQRGTRVALVDISDTGGGSPQQIFLGGTGE